MDNKADKSDVGYTLFKSTGVQHEFPHINLEKQQVIGIVTYKEKTYMTVFVNLKTGSVQVQGDIDDLGDLSMDRDAYVDMFKHQAQFFIDNNISNPKEYYDELIKGQS
ncbi:hypothetical protein A8F94_15330 [Bacillus sp. FJAT-27225]|uniref:hypothetical protein n=1 Tax=Bacillus sp. FJAT-27225 TaxID=1743144 RepID=UPI00080C33A3|nr:hypothetical protein [Bacillus sp. FJAT-27225]OCA84096.1 hypothetical protein A8F94_15330 [Bacillus sp. FJAT-27225]